MGKVRPFRKCGYLDAAIGWVSRDIQTGTQRTPFEGVGDWVVTPALGLSDDFHATHMPTGRTFCTRPMPLALARIVAAYAEIRLPRIASREDAKKLSGLARKVRSEVLA